MVKLRAALFIFFNCFLLTGVYSQPDLPEFGKIDIADLQMKECPFDKGADAMNLFNYGDAEIYPSSYSYFIRIEHRTRIKIFTQNGVKHATIDIPYINSDRFHIKDVSAITYNLDGAGNIVIQKIDSKDIFKQKVNDNEKSIRFAFPNVKPGSVIEFKYTERRDYTRRISPWLFDDDLPTALSYFKLSYKLELHAEQRIATTMHVETTSDTNLTDGIVMRTYIMRNIPTYRYEPFVSSLKDNIQFVEFDVNYSWNNDDNLPAAVAWSKFCVVLLRDRFFGRQFDKELPVLKHTVESISKLSYRERINTVFQLVKDNIEWNKEYDFYADNIDEIWTAKKGSSGDINLTLLNILRKVGITCYPILVSTKNNGLANEKYNSLSQFDCVDVLVIDSSASYVLDATQKKQDYKVTPLNVINTNAFLVDARKGQWIKIEESKPLIRNVINVKADIDSAGIMRGTVYEYFYDYAKLDILENASKKDRKDESKDLLQNEITDLKIDSIKDQNADADDKPLVRSFNFRLEMQQTGDFFFFNPMFLTPFKKNPFTDSVRRANIDFGCNQSYSVGMYITLPGNIEIPELPADKEIRLADTSFAYGRLIAKQNNALIIRSHFDLNNSVFSADQYPLVKQVFEKMYAMLNEQVIFKRKN